VGECSAASETGVSETRPSSSRRPSFIAAYNPSEDLKSEDVKGAISLGGKVVSDTMPCPEFRLM
jgi:hypothetical protein